MLHNAFSNRAVNLLNLHFGLAIFAEALINIFLAIYLFEKGISLPIIFLSFAFINLCRVFLRPLVMKVCRHWGLRKTLIFGTLVHIPVYPLLAKISGFDLWFVLFTCLAVVPWTFYWTSYHPYFSMLGEHEHRGKHIGMREIFSRGSAFLAPLLGAALISWSGPATGFLAAMIFMALAAVPLFFMPDVVLSPEMNFRTALRTIGKEGFWLFFADNLFLASENAWYLVLFFTLQNYIAYGGLLSLAIFFQILLSVFTGWSFDNGNGRRLLPFGILFISIAILSRIFFTLSIPTIIAIDFLFMLGYSLYMPLRDSVIYNFSKASPCPLWFHYFAEVGADFGAAGSFIIAAIFVASGGDLRLVMLLGIIALFISRIVMRKYFQQQKRRGMKFSAI